MKTINKSILNCEVWSRKTQTRKSLKLLMKGQQRDTFTKYLKDVHDISEENVNDELKVFMAQFINPIYVPVIFDGVRLGSYGEIFVPGFGSMYLYCVIEELEKVTQKIQDGTYHFEAGFKYPTFNLKDFKGVKTGEGLTDYGTTYEVYETPTGFFSFEKGCIGDGGYAGYVGKETIEQGMNEVVEFLQICSYVKDCDLLTNRLGGLSYNELPLKNAA
jgi:hypothetical protein